MATYRELLARVREEIEEMMETHADTKTITCTDCERDFYSSCSFYYHCKKCLEKTNEGKFTLLNMV